MDIKKLVDTQREFYFTGETLGCKHRKDALEKLLNVTYAREPELLAALKTDLNKSKTEALMTELSILRGELRYLLKHLKRFIKPRRAKTPLVLFPADCRRVPEPYGCVLIMSPWNYPLLLTLQPLAGALAAGNCAVVKPSAYAPATSALIADIIAKLYEPGFVSAVTGSRKENTELLAQKFDYIFFTGSLAVGRAVMSAASVHLTPVTLELGGKSPVIVDESADCELAGRKLAFGKFINAGQTCVAPDYVFVHESKKAALVAALKKYIGEFYPPREDGSIADYPKIINEKHFDRVLGLLCGADILYGGGSDREKLTIYPTVCDGVDFDSPVMKEEIFGPILPLITYTDINEVVRKLQSLPKPLACYLFTESKASVELYEKRLSFGGGCINDCLVQLASDFLPFGGVGESGMGSYHGRASFETFSHFKSVVFKAKRPDIAVRYRPWGRTAEKFFDKL